MRVRQIVDNRIDQAYTDAFNSATGNNLTLEEMQAAAFALLSDQALQADLAVAADYIRQVEANIANLQRLVTQNPNAVEAATIQAAIASIVEIFQTPFDEIQQP